MSVARHARIAQTAQAALAYLSHGADPFAVDNSEKSVSRRAYTQWLMGSSCMGDVWDAVLADIGVDVAENRRQSGSRRVAKYDKYYSRQDFEELWKGRERLCPYYDGKISEAVMTVPPKVHRMTMSRTRMTMGAACFDTGRLLLFISLLLLGSRYST